MSTPDDHNPDTRRILMDCIFGVHEIIHPQLLDGTWICRHCHLMTAGTEVAEAMLAEGKDRLSVAEASDEFRRRREEIVAGTVYQWEHDL